MQYSTDSQNYADRVFSGKITFGSAKLIETFGATLRSMRRRGNKKFQQMVNL